MPIKSWNFIHNGYPIRAEIWWRFSGWSRRQLYVNHKKVAVARGWFCVRRPLFANLATQDGVNQNVTVRFRCSWTGFDMRGWFAEGADPFAPIPSTRVYRHLQHNPERGEEIENVLAHRLGCLMVFGFLLCMCVLYAPLMIAGGAVHAVSESRRRTRMKKLHRYLSWADL